MYRKAIESLRAWKKSPRRIPLILRGGRQVGKTWLMEEFGRREYETCAYINFEGNDRMLRLFSGDLDVSRILSGLRLETGCAIDPEKTLIVFDEIQAVPMALTSLKYFQENAPEYHVIAAGSLLGVALHPETSFPVGKVDFCDIAPLDFSEFLRAMGKEEFLSVLEKGEWEIVSSFRDTFVELLKQYLLIGGMPEVVSVFSETRGYEEARAIQRRILAAYEQDVSKHAPNEAVPRIRMLWNSIPSQLARENRKFLYGLVREGARAREYELALTWLIDCGLVHRVKRVTKPGMPLRAYEELSAFKLFLLDVGLLSAMTELDPKTLLDGSRIFEEFKGALTEQYVLQQLKATDALPVNYWSADSGTAEVDFVIQSHGLIVPVEVKAAENLKAKSLRVYREKFAPEISVRTSLSDFRREAWLVNIPLYGISQIQKQIGRS